MYLLSNTNLTNLNLSTTDDNVITASPVIEQLDNINCLTHTVTNDKNDHHHEQK